MKTAQAMPAATRAPLTVEVLIGNFRFPEIDLRSGRSSRGKGCVARKPPIRSSFPRDLAGRACLGCTAMGLDESLGKSRS